MPRAYNFPQLLLYLIICNQTNCLQNCTTRFANTMYIHFQYQSFRMQLQILIVHTALVYILESQENSFDLCKLCQVIASIYPTNNLHETGLASPTLSSQIDWVCLVASGPELIRQHVVVGLVPGGAVLLTLFMHTHLQVELACASARGLCLVAWSDR